MSRPSTAPCSDTSHIRSRFRGQSRVDLVLATSRARSDLCGSPGCFRCTRTSPCPPRAPRDPRREAALVGAVVARPVVEAVTGVLLSSREPVHVRDAFQPLAEPPEIVVRVPVRRALVRPAASRNTPEAVLLIELPGARRELPAFEPPQGLV